MKPEKIEELIEFYYDELNYTLNEINLKLRNFPTLQEFKDEYKRKLFYGKYFWKN